MELFLEELVWRYSESRLAETPTSWVTKVLRAYYPENTGYKGHSPQHMRVRLLTYAYDALKSVGEKYTQPFSISGFYSRAWGTRVAVPNHMRE